ncbi:MAG: hypothetical protein MJ252_19020 [archaeon]|nr:hypothetical protein [archaeon]
MELSERNTDNTNPPLSQRKSKGIGSGVKNNKFASKHSYKYRHRASLTPTRKTPSIAEEEHLNFNTLMEPTTKQPLRARGSLKNKNQLEEALTKLNIPSRRIDQTKKLTICPDCKKLTNFSVFYWQGRPKEFYISCEKCHNEKKCQPYKNSVKDFLKYAESSESECTDPMSCEYNDSHTNSGIIGKEYCVQCHKWLCEDCLTLHKKSFDLNKHYTCKREINVDNICKDHNSQYEFYCIQCKEHGCNSCPDKHVDHLSSLIPLKNLLTQEQIDIIEQNITKAKEYLQLYNKKLFENMNMILIKQLIALEKAYNHYQEINSDIIKYSEIMLQNYRSSVPNYSLYENLVNNTQFEFKEIRLNFDYSVENYNMLLDHFNNDILIQPWEHEEVYHISDYRWKRIEHKIYKGYTFKNCLNFNNGFIRSDAEFQKHLEEFEPSAFTMEDARKINFKNKDLIVVNGVNATEVRKVLGIEERYVIFYEQNEMENTRNYCAIEVEKVPKNATISFFSSAHPRKILLKTVPDFFKEIKDI